MIHSATLRVRYSEIDAQGHVNNATYLSYFEVGRVEWLRALGFSYKELEARGIGFVVVEALVRYHKASFFDDELTVGVTLAESNRASLCFEYAVSRGGDRISTGHTRHACVDLATGKARRLPESFLARLAEVRTKP